MKPASFQSSRRAWTWPAAGLLLALCILLPGQARADCKFHPGNMPTTISINPPAQINVPMNAPIGTVLWVSPLQSPSPVTRVQCNNRSPNSTGIAGAAQSLGGIPTFATGNPAIGYQVAANDSSTWVQAYPNGPALSVAQNILDTPMLVRLVVLAPVGNGSSIGGGTLGNWDVAGIGHAVALNFTHGVRFLAPACSVTTNPTNVTLPDVPTAAFVGNGATAGTTPFALQLTCAAGSTLAILLDTNTPAAGSTSVIAATSGAGYAQGVGVQVLDRHAVPVTFAQPATIGATLNGPLTVTYLARYYQTGPVSPGQVKATATFTLIYQ